jgi:hypothetical protein
MLIAKSNLVVTHDLNHHEAPHLAMFSHSTSLFVIHNVLIFAKVELIQEVQFQYFHVVLQSNDTRYFNEVFVGSVELSDTELIQAIQVVLI